MTSLALHQRTVDDLLADRLAIGGGRHLIPTPEAPKCSVCQGKTPRRLEDGVIIVCRLCNDGDPKELTLTAECATCAGQKWTEHEEGPERCEDCMASEQRPVAVVHVEAVLPVRDLANAAEDDHEYPHVCTLGDSVLVLKLTDGPSNDDDIDVSHLRALSEWSGYALLATRIETT